MDWMRPDSLDCASDPFLALGSARLIWWARADESLYVQSMSDIAAADVENSFEEEVEGSPNIVRIGKKPIMNYVVACMTLLNNGDAEVMVRARGQSITKAVETVEMLRRAFLKNIKVYSVDIGTEEVKREDGSTASLSMIEIVLGH